MLFSKTQSLTVPRKIILRLQPVARESLTFDVLSLRAARAFVQKTVDVGLPDLSVSHHSIDGEHVHYFRVSRCRASAERRARRDRGRHDRAQSDRDDTPVRLHGRSEKASGKR